MIISGTGHRPNKLGGYSEEVFNRLVEVALLGIPEDTTKIISGMALGWDTALAEAAIRKKIPFIVAVPFLGQEKMWPKASQEKYQHYLKQAEDVLYICDQGYAPWKMRVRDEYMVDHSDVVLALWNGSPSGTGNCVTYAKKQNKPIKNVWNLFNDQTSHYS